jgi:hypothetical protein
MAELADKIAVLMQRNPPAMIRMAPRQPERPGVGIRPKALALVPRDAELVALASMFLSEDVPS